MTTLVAGILVAFLATTLAAARRLAPTRASCPECGGRTEAVRAPLWLRKAAPDLSLRWCPSCSWEGMGRVGPEWIPGHRTAHGSGFYWGNERLPADFGFRFAPAPADPTEAPGEPPAHPSGFRFAGAHAVPTTARAFQWAEPLGPSSFQWRTRRRPAAPAGFYWKN